MREDVSEALEAAAGSDDVRGTSARFGTRANVTSHRLGTARTIVRRFLENVDPALTAFEILRAFEDEGAEAALRLDDEDEP